MAWEDLKAAVSAVITENGNNEITGEVLESLINENIIPQIGSAKYKGLANPTTVPPASPQSEIFYITKEAGTYSNFGGLVLDDRLNVLVYRNGWVSESWAGSTGSKTYDSLQDAIDYYNGLNINSKPEDGTEFKVSEVTDPTSAGTYTFQSSESLKYRLEKSFFDSCRNRILDIKTYGFPKNFNAISTIQFSYNPERESFQSSRLAYFDMDLEQLGISDNGDIEQITARYMAIVVSDVTSVIQFRTINASNQTVDAGTTKILGDKKMVYVDTSLVDTDRVRLYLNVNCELFDIYYGDDVPNFNIDPLIIENPETEIEYLWIGNPERKKSSIKGYKGQNLILPVNPLNIGKFKRYVFFEIEKSRPDLIMPVEGRLLNAVGSVIFDRVYNRGKYGYFELETEQDREDARGFQFVISNIYQGGTDQDWVIVKNIRTSNSLSLNLKEDDDIPSFKTSYEAKDIGLDLFRVGNKIWNGKAPESIRRDNDLSKGGYSDVSMYEYTGKALSHRNIESIDYVDTKGAASGGRQLLNITKDGVMYFKDGVNLVSISFEDFLESIVDHDQIGLTIDNIDFLNLPENATAQQKQDEWDRMRAKWKMLPQSTVLNTYGDNPLNPTLYSSLFGNGSLMSSNQLIRKGGEVVVPKLKNPIIGNPTHLLIYDGANSLIEEIEIGPHTNLKKGLLNADQGSITYPDPIEAVIDFYNGQEIIVPVSLSAGTYKIVVRGRRYSTTLVDGTIEVSNNNGSSGSIIMDGNTGNNMATLVDREATITLTNTTEIKLTAQCDVDKPLAIGNGSSSRSCWGYTARGRFGTIVEYNAAPQRRAGMSYFTMDNGETWQMLFDVSLNELFMATAGHHMHGACYDPYWEKFFLIGGDAEENRPMHHCEVNDDINLSNVIWKETYSDPDLYKVAAGEQYCSVYAHKDYLLFGTDFTLTGMFRMPRIDKENMTDREPCFIINNLRITHIPSTFYQKNENEELFCISMKGDGNSSFAPREYQCSLLHSTMDGVTWKEVWKDEVANGGFGFNNFIKVFHYDDYVILHYFNDRRFSNNHTLAIIKYL